MAICKLLLVAAVILVASFTPSFADDPGRNAVVAKMHQIADEIEKENSEEKKFDKTRELAWLIKQNKDIVDSETIDDLIKLFGKEDSRIRKWVAMSLGEIGPRARKAIPLLKAALDHEDCQWKSENSTLVIVGTLKKLGETVKYPCDE